MSTFDQNLNQKGEGVGILSRPGMVGWVGYRDGLRLTSKFLGDFFFFFWGGGGAIFLVVPKSHIIIIVTIVIIYLNIFLCIYSFICIFVYLFIYLFIYLLFGYLLCFFGYDVDVDAPQV